MEIHASQKEVLASPYYYYDEYIWWANHLKPRFSSGSVYLHTFLIILCLLKQS